MNYPRDFSMINWRKWNKILHRDFGYLCVGLTIIYAVSGIAVNHIDTWNPTYSTEIIESNIGPVSGNGKIGEEDIRYILDRLKVKGKYKSSFFENRETIKIFIENNTVTVNLSTGDTVQEIVVGRPLLHEFNFLHLNHPKKLWTYIADVYALMLILLAGTGLFMIKGKKGITGRGAWMSILGIAVPVFVLFLYF